MAAILFKMSNINCFFYCSNTQYINETFWSRHSDKTFRLFELRSFKITLLKNKKNKKKNKKGGGLYKVSGRDAKHVSYFTNINKLYTSVTFCWKSVKGRKECNFNFKKNEKMCVGCFWNHECPAPAQQVAKHKPCLIKIWKSETFISKKDKSDSQSHWGKLNTILFHIESKSGCAKGISFSFFYHN